MALPRRAVRGGIIAAAGAIALTFAVTARPGALAIPGTVPPDPGAVYSPVRAGEELPHGFFQVYPRDVIEPVYDPRFVAADEARWPADADVIGVRIGDTARAYPISFLNWREMVVDEIEGVPILVTWCPLCGTALVHDRRLDGEPIAFGVQGALYLNAMTWWDHDTGSIWSQPLGTAIAGPRKGAELELLPSTFTTWGAWRAAHPDTAALDAPGNATGFDLTDLYVVVDFGDDVRGYPIERLRAAGVVNDTVAGVDIAVVIDPTEPDRWAVFARHLPARATTVELEVAGDVLRDRRSGTTFHASRGIGLDGPLAEEVLAPLPALVSRPGSSGPTRVPVFDALWPHGTVWRP